MPQGIPTRRYGDGTVTSKKLSDNYLKGLVAYERFDHQPSISAPNGYGDPTGAGGDINRALFRGGLYARYQAKGTQTLLGPLADVDKGLDISQDQTDNDGVEYVFGALGLFSPFVYTVPDYAFVELEFRIADVSGTDDCALGFRKNEAGQANIDDYDEAGWVNIILGDVKVETILNNAATITTDSGVNWADDETHTVRVELRGRSLAYYFDDTILPGIPAYQFDVGEVVVPFFFFLQATTNPGKVWWKHIWLGVTDERTSTGNPG